MAASRIHLQTNASLHFDVIFSYMQLDCNFQQQLMPLSTPLYMEIARGIGSWAMGVLITNRYSDP